MKWFWKIPGVSWSEGKDYLVITFARYDGQIAYKAPKLSSKSIIFVRCSLISLPYFLAGLYGIQHDQFLHQKVPRDTFKLALNLFRENARCIDTKFRLKIESEMQGIVEKLYPCSFTSFVAPISSPDDLPPPSKVCYVCGKEEVAGKCEKCRAVRYCGIECQRYDYKNGHKAVCMEGL